MSVRFDVILELLGSKIYDSPFAAIRENLQNAVDAIRLRLAHGDSFSPAIYLNISEKEFRVSDNGIGMSMMDMETYYWAVGKSGKTGLEDLCIGTFGIGALANFGIAESVAVVSRKSTEDKWCRSSITKEEIKSTGGSPPSVNYTTLRLAREDIGTEVSILFEKPVDPQDVVNYVNECIGDLGISVFINNSPMPIHKPLAPPSNAVAKEHGTTTLDLSYHNISIKYRVYEGKEGLFILFQSQHLSGLVVPNSGLSVVYNRGFKICDVKTPNRVEICVLVDTFLFRPTAGRDTLDGYSANMFHSLMQQLEALVVKIASKSNTRLRATRGVFRYRSPERLEKKDLLTFDHLQVPLVGQEETELREIRVKHAKSSKNIFYTDSNSKAARSVAGRGHTVVVLPGDYHERIIVARYLEEHCRAENLQSFAPLEKELALIELDSDEKKAVAHVERIVNDMLGNTMVRVVPAILRNDLIFHWSKEEYINVFGNTEASQLRREEDIYFAVRHPEIRRVIKDLPSAYQGFEMNLLENILLDQLGELIYKFRKKFLGVGGRGIKALLESHLSIYRLSLRDVERINNSRTAISIDEDDIETLSTENRKEPTGKILHFVEDSLWSDRDYYLKLDKHSDKLIRTVSLASNHIDIWWSSNIVSYHFWLFDNELVVINIEIDKIITVQDQMTGVFQEGRLPLIYKNSSYLPIPRELETYMVPNYKMRVVTLYIRSRVLALT